jgi:hypothetical protein
MVPSLSTEPKNLAVIAKRIYLTGIGSDLNDLTLPCDSPRGGPPLHQTLTAK